jgi:uncharacterized membrane protein
MTSLADTRIRSIDLLKGLVMIIMALDHTRDYFHASAYLFDPADPTQTSLPIFFTRWITHFCAPAFSFLAGLSAFMAGKRKSRSQLSGFLLKRGLWLIFIELTFVNFAWYFDIHFRTFGLLVIWALGISMIVLAALVHLPRKAILVFSCLLIFGHNLLDSVHFDGLWWSMLHELTFYKLPGDAQLLVAYPIIPWIAVMALGYCFGTYYEPSFGSGRRKKLFNTIGLAALLLFIIGRWVSIYGNPTPWKHYSTISQNIISFLNPDKYPPSLLYLLMTLGVVLVFLANSEKLRGGLVNFFSTFGRVPFFYYILHLYLIHGVAVIFAWLSGFGWDKLILSTWISFDEHVKGYGFSLWVVYAVWIGVVLCLYPLCKMFDNYKQRHKEKWWLSYL